LYETYTGGATMPMPTPQFTLAAQVNRVPSMRVPLDGTQGCASSD
jgi:hypothetical protein